MGGFGSGRMWDLATRTRTVNYCRSIDVKWLKEKGYLNGKKSGGISWLYNQGETLGSVGFIVCFNVPGKETIRFQYNQTNAQGEKTVFDYPVLLDKTPCIYGGHRYWFRCPMCNVRRFALFFPENKQYFGCRRCYGLTYNSCLNSHKGNILPDLDKIDMNNPRFSLAQIARLMDMGY